MISSAGGAAGMAAVLLVVTSIVAVSARPNQGLFIDDVRRPVYRGNIRYNFNSDSFRGFKWASTNDSNINSLKLFSRQNSTLNQAKSDYISPTPQSNKFYRKNKIGQAFIKPNDQVISSKPDNITRSISSNLDFNNKTDHIYVLLNSSLADTSKVNSNISKPSDSFKKISDQNYNNVENKTSNNNIVKLTRLNPVGHKRKLVRIRVRNNQTSSQLPKKTKKKLVDSQELVQNFISNSIKHLNPGKEASKNNSLWESMTGLADALPQGKRPILIYPQGNPPNWTENPNDSSFILVEDITDPDLLPKPENVNDQTSNDQNTESAEMNKLKDYLLYLTSSSKPSQIPAGIKPGFMTNKPSSQDSSKISSTSQSNFIPIKPVKIVKPSLVTTTLVNVGPSTPGPVLISHPSLKNKTSYNKFKGGVTVKPTHLVHVSTVAPTNTPLYVKPTLNPQDITAEPNFENNKVSNKHDYQNINHIKPGGKPYYEYPRPEISDPWWPNVESSTSASWPQEVTTGSWHTVTEGEKLERPIYVNHQSNSESVSSPVRPIYYPEYIGYPKPVNPPSESTHVHKPLYVYVPPPSTPVYKPVYVLPNYPDHGLTSSDAVTPPSGPIDITRPYPSADELPVPGISGVSNPPLGPTIILAPAQNDPYPPSRPPPPSIVILESGSPLSDDPLDISPLQDPLPEACRSFEVNVNGSNQVIPTGRQCPINIIINNIPQGAAAAGPTLAPLAGGAASPVLQPLADILPTLPPLLPMLPNATNILSGNNIMPVTQADVDVTTVTNTNKPSQSSSSSTYLDYLYPYLPFFNPLFYPLFLVLLGPIKVLVLGAFILSGFLFPVLIFRAILGLFLG